MEFEVSVFARMCKYLKIRHLPLTGDIKNLECKILNKKLVLTFYTTLTSFSLLPT